MAWSQSQAFGFMITQLAANVVKPTTDAYKAALYASNTMTPDATVSTAVLTEYNGAASQWVVANEVSSVNYTAGGIVVTPTAVTQNYNSQGGNVVAFNSSGSPQWTVVSFTAFGLLVYDTTVSNEGLCFNYFGGAQTVTAGTFTVTWGANGICKFTC